MSAHIRDYYYVTILNWLEYMHMALKAILDETIAQHNLKTIASNGWEYIQIEKSIPGL